MQKHTCLQIASKNDIHLLLPLVKDYHEYEGIQLSGEARENTISTLLSNSDLGAIWMILDKDKMVGYIALCVGYSIEFSGLDAFIDEFYIQPDHRGQGIGTQVLSQIKKEAKKMGIGALHLEVARNNSRAKHLYSKANFIARDRYTIMSADI